MVTETGLHVEVTADIAQFEAKLRAAEARLLGTSTVFTEFSGKFPQLAASANASMAKVDTAVKKASKSVYDFGNKTIVAEAQIKTMGTGVKAAGQHLTNMTAQFNDIGVMLAAGQSPFMLAMQQGTQLNQIFDQLDKGTGSLRTRLGALASGFMQAINPANLLTIAVIAGGVALAQWAISAFRAEDSTDKLQRSLDELDSVMGGLDKATTTLEMSAFSLAEKYGILADRARELAILQAHLAENRAIQAFEEQAGSIDRVTQRYVDLSSSMTLHNAVIQKIAREFQVTTETAIQLRDAFIALDAAPTAQEQAKVYSDIGLILAENNVELANIPPKLLESVRAGQQLEQVMLDTEAAMARVAQAGAGISAAFPMTATGDASDLFNADGSPALAPPALPGAPGGGGGGADRTKEELEQLQQSLMTEAELQLAAYEEQQLLLEAALDKKLLTQIEYYDTLEKLQAQHQDKMGEIDAYRYGDSVDKVGAFLGDMSTIMAAGNEKMLKISQAFAAAQALVYTLEGAAKELRNGTFGFAQAAAVIAKGMGFISAINGVSSGSTSAASAGLAGAATTSTATTATEATTSSNVAIQLTGGDMFSRDQVTKLINQINEAVGDGAVVRLV